MWFKNLCIYRITQQLDISLETLEAALRSKPSQKPASQTLQTVGFISPASKDPAAPLAHQVEGVYLVALRKYERMLPGVVVKDAVSEKVEEIENTQQRKVYRKERDQIKDEVIQALLPHAFVRKSTLYAAVDLKENLIFVNTSSASAAEEILSTLREVLGSLPVRPLTTKIAPSATYTDWVRTESAIEDLYVLNDCRLHDTGDDGGEIRVKNQDLTGDEIKNLVAAGKVVTQVSLAYKDQLSFTVDDRLIFRGLRFEKLLQEQAIADGGEDDSGQFDASFWLMINTLNSMLPAVLTGLGGEELPQQV